MIDFSSSPTLSKRKAKDLLALPFWKGKHTVEPAAPMGKLYDDLELPIGLGDFTGEEGQIVLLYLPTLPEKRVVLIGLGKRENLSLERLRRCYSFLVKLCHNRGLEDLNLLVPQTSLLEETAIVEAIAEGMWLQNYTFPIYKTANALLAVPKKTITKVALIGASRQALQHLDALKPVIEGVYLARHLANTNADAMTPQHLIDQAHAIAKTSPKVKVTIFNKKRLEQEGFGLLLAVGQGAACDPALIVMEYSGQPKSSDRTVLVGKGVTFDSGGLNLKMSGMETMKGDMSGAAALMGVMHAVGKLAPSLNVTAVIPTAENAIDAKSFKPGDVYTSYNGTTVEIGNTDAEGRLILADALSYAVRNLAPSRIIDIATLTGACVVALGDEVSGMMSNDTSLAHKLQKAGEHTFERVWNLPLYDEYREALRSEVADLKNVGGRAAGAILAGKFLQHFVGKTPWAHLDVAGPAFLDKEKRYLPKGGTGIPVRLLVHFLLHSQKQ